MSAATTDKEPKSKLPKVLRIGIIQGGKIIEERRLKRRETVSIGQSDKATFTVAGVALPKTFDLFECVAGKYTIRLNDTMTGGVQKGQSAVTDYKTMRSAGKLTKKGDVYIVPLTDESRGKVIMGDLTVLFQFVDPPLAPARMEIPADVKGNILQTVDIQFSSILVATMLMSISVASYAAQQPYVEPSTIEQISERFQVMIMPDRIPEPPKDPNADKDAKGDVDKGKDKAKKKKRKKKKTKVAKKGKEGGGKKVSAEAAARAKKEAARKAVAGKGLLAVIGTAGDGPAAGGALADVFKDGGFQESELGNAFSGIQGIDVADSSGAAGTRGGGAGESAGIGDLGTEGGGDVTTGNKVETKVSGRVGTEAPEVEGDLSPAKIQRAMRKYVSGVKDCYERALKRNPKLAGKIVIGFEILENGKVAEFDFPEDTVGSESVRVCIKKRSRMWRFPRPEGGGVYVQFPLVFEPSG